MFCLVAVSNTLSLLAKIIVVWLAAPTKILDQRDLRQYKRGARHARVLT
jgi:hypothetical protein